MTLAIVAAICFFVGYMCGAIYGHRDGTIQERKKYNSNDFRDDVSSGFMLPREKNDAEKKENW